MNDELRSNILRILFLLGGTILFGTIAYHILENWNIFDCLYMTVITITTTGYREVGEMSVYGRILSMFLMFFGVGIFFYAINMIIPSLVERRIKRWEKMLEKMSDHYIICGFGLMGREIAKELPKDKIVIVDIDINKIDIARENGYIAVHGDATDDAVLDRAQVRRAKAIICCMTDSSNAFAIMTAKYLNPKITTIAVLRSPDAERKIERVGADFLLSPYRDTAKKVFALLTRKASIEFIEIISDREKLSLEKMIVEEKIAGKTLKELDLVKRTGCIIAAVVRNGEVIVPKADLELKKGDVVFIIGSEEGLKRLEEIIWS